MKHTATVLLICLAVLFTAHSAFSDSPYATNADRAIQWLSQHQNPDGSWGASDDIKLPCTTEAVLALQALNQRTPSYYWGITWLENHHAPNIDYRARRILALAAHGDNVQAELAAMQAAQMLTLPGNSAWGLTKEYQGTALDSAVALLASSQLGITANIQPALNYLKGAQLTGGDKGWTVAQESTADALTTAFVVRSLVGYQSLDPSLSTNISNGVASLAANVTTASPIRLQTLAALAYLRAGYSSNATPLLNAIAASQSSDGSCLQDSYITAVAARTFAAAMQTDLAGLSDTVNAPDSALRAAINAALGKNSMDTLTKGDMANLVTLSAVNMGINDLTGMEWAVNLVSADLRNNNISNFTPVTSLPTNPTVQMAGNPGTPPPDMPPGYPEEAVAVPALSWPAILVTVLLLIATAAFIFKRQRRSPLIEYGSVDGCCTASPAKQRRNTARFFIALFCTLVISPTALAGEIGTRIVSSGAVRMGTESASGREIRSSRIDQEAAVRAAIDAKPTERMEEVRSAGQRILAARKRQAEREDDKDLREKIDTLRKALMDVQQASMRPSSSGLVIKGDTKAPPSSKAPSVKTGARMKTARDNGLSALNQLRVKQAQSAFYSRDEHALQGSFLRQRNEKLEAVEQDVEALLRSSDAPSQKEIEATIQRLTIHRPTVKADPGHPTIRAMTQHR